MRWETPPERLTDAEQLDELLRRASDDWVHPADVFDVARFSGITDAEPLVEHAISLTRELLRRGLVIAGDLTEVGYEPWSLGPEDSGERVARQWRDDPEAAATSFSVWLEATPAGLEQARRPPDTGRR